jgi:hypothetical protein
MSRHVVWTVLYEQRGLGILVQPYFVLDDPLLTYVALPPGVTSMVAGYYAGPWFEAVAYPEHDAHRAKGPPNMSSRGLLSRTSPRVSAAPLPSTVARTGSKSGNGAVVEPHPSPRTRVRHRGP